MDIALQKGEEVKLLFFSQESERWGSRLSTRNYPERRLSEAGSSKQNPAPREGERWAAEQGLTEAGWGGWKQSSTKAQT